MLRFSGSNDPKRFVCDHIRNRKDLDGAVVVDIPAGTGVMSKAFQEMGAEVRAYDLFPEFFQVETITCVAADLQKKLPIEDHVADLVLCQEGIEHLPDQLAALREMNRILKPSGTLLLTTPNISNLRARASNFFTESEVYKRMPPNEVDGLWFSDDGRMYFGHLFLIGIQRLRTLTRIAGFEIDKIHPARPSTSSLVLGVFYPLIVLINLWALRRNVKRNKNTPKGVKEKVYGEAARLNMNPTVLFGKNLFIELRKSAEWTEVELGSQQEATEERIALQKQTYLDT